MHLVWLIRYGQTDLSGLLNSATKTEYLKHIIFLFESSIKTGNDRFAQLNIDKSKIQQMTIIFDMEGLSFRQLSNKQGDYYKLVKFNIWHVK